MAEEITFTDLMRRVRAGDQQAITMLVDRYGDAVRRVARVRLRSRRLRRVLDSSDIGQSVLFSFVRRAGNGEWQDNLNSPEELLKLLATMARYKVIDQERKAHAARRGGGDLAQPLDDYDLPFTRSKSPSEQVADQELIALAKENLSADERRLLELHFGDGLEWKEIAERVGGSPEALRMKLRRAFGRLRELFGDKEGDGGAI
jgi:RNA polymerase sigma factor (sigma-70 family)